MSGFARCSSGLLDDQRRLRERGKPQTGRDKINALQASFLDQLREYGFRSVPIGELIISEDTYLPTYEGFDLGFDRPGPSVVRRRVAAAYRRRRP